MEASGTVLDLFVPAPRFIANVKKIPTSIVVPAEENLVAHLLVFSKTRSVIRALDHVVTETGRQYTHANRQA
jgi:hypothetical protein